MPATLTQKSIISAWLPPKSDTGTRETGGFKPKGRRVRIHFLAGTSSAAGTFRLRRASDAAASGAENASATIAFGGTSTTGDNVPQVVEIDPSLYVTTALPFLSVQVAAGGTYLSAVLVEEYDLPYSPDTNLTGLLTPAAPAAA